jgi:protein-L-isoaspartate(D-aspartate) O-methyltransferase
MRDSIKYKRQREEMVRQQIAARGITEPEVLAAFHKVQRHLFVSEALRDQAYGDYPLPIGEQQTISQPYIVAEMTQALELNKDDRVLEIGTGSGYQAAILAEVVYRVYTIERIRSLYVQTRSLLDKLHYHNIVMRCSDGTSGWQDESPFDAIMVTAGAPDVPQKLLDQLGISWLKGGAWWCQSAISIPRTSSSTPKMKGASTRQIWEDAALSN